MGSDPAWPLPSDSRRVRVHLYLAEGLIVAAGSLLIAVGLAGAYLVDVRPGSFDPHITPFGAFTLLFMGFLILKWRVIKTVSPPPEKAPKLQDWWETREWRWVLAVAIPVCGVLVAVARSLWSWWELVFLNGFDLLLLGMILTGVLLYTYVLHKLGM